MLLRYILILFLFAAVAPISAQNKIRWITWEEALKKQEKNPKKIFVDVIIDRCVWCKKMDANTFSEDHIAKFINEYYYAVRFDAYSRSPITYNGQVYNFESTFNGGGYHQLAAFLLQGKLSYPTNVFIDENLQVIQAIPGYQSPIDFEMIIHFFGEDHYKTTHWRKFTRNFITSKGVPSSAGKN